VNSVLIVAPLADVAPGTLAGDIAAACVAANYEVTLYCPLVASDPAEGDPLVQSLPLLRDPGELYEPAAQTAHYVLDLFDNGPYGWREEKQRVLNDLQRLPDNLPLLTTCVTGSATDAAAMFGRPTQVVGFAAVQPFNAVNTVELLLPLQGDEAMLEFGRAFFQTIGKETMRIPDGPGGVMARILAMIVNEAAYALQEGVASAEDIDTAMKLGANHPYGPLAWADLLGLDVVHATLWALHQELGDDRYRPCPLLARMVRAGLRGKPSGRGFYTYDEANPR
jgi:3-hydroxybutyryl-CoA dehydrogenase